MTENRPIFRGMKTWRAVRAFTKEAVSRDDLRHLLQAARWAPSAGNRRIHKFVVVDEREIIEKIRDVAPGMLGHPAAIIVICTDKEKAVVEGVKLALDTTTWIDVGAAAQNIILAAHELELGACPLTSFSRAGVRALLRMPERLEPEYIVQLGRRVPETRALRAGVSLRLPIEDISFWGAFPEET